MKGAFCHSLEYTVNLLSYTCNFGPMGLYMHTCPWSGAKGKSGPWQKYTIKKTNFSIIQLLPSPSVFLLQEFQLPLCFTCPPFPESPIMVCPLEAETLFGREDFFHLYSLPCSASKLQNITFLGNILSDIWLVTLWSNILIPDGFSN